MERGSDRHGPRLDEEQKREVEGLERGAPTSPRVEEHRMTEDPGGEEEARPPEEPATEEPPPEPEPAPEDADAGGPPPA
jgi:hypothetical protein